MTAAIPSHTVVLMKIRSLDPRDKSEWLRMRTALWPESPQDHEPEIKQFFAGSSPIAAVFVAQRTGGRLAGFLECGRRAYAEGSQTSPVGYIEGWWVDPEARHQGIGALLVSSAEDWALSQGYTEMASDADFDNEVSQRAHRALGYDETRRVVCYRKQLDRLVGRGKYECIYRFGAQRELPFTELDRVDVNDALEERDELLDELVTRGMRADQARLDSRRYPVAHIKRHLMMICWPEIQTRATAPRTIGRQWSRSIPSSSAPARSAMIPKSTPTTTPTLESRTEANWVRSGLRLASDGGRSVRQLPIGAACAMALHSAVFAQDTSPAITKLTNIETSYPYWSPDGARIVLQSNRIDGNREIFVMDADGSGLVRITHDPGEDQTPVWSPDGRRIAFQSNRSGNWDIYLMSVDGSGVVNLTNSPSADSHPQWAPDGRRIIFDRPLEEEGGIENDEIFEISVDGSDLRRVSESPHRDTDASISPDGTRILWRRRLRDPSEEGGFGNSEADLGLQ